MGFFRRTPRRSAEPAGDPDPAGQVRVDLRTFVLLLTSAGCVWFGITHPTLAVAVGFALTVLVALDRIVKR